MIKELKKENDFFQDDPIFRKYFFKGDNHTEHEIERGDALIKKLDEFSMKVFGKEFSYGYGYWFNYLDDYGYYVLTDSDRGHFHVFGLGEDVDEAANHIIEDDLFDSAFSYECSNRKELKEDFNERFGSFDFKPLYGLESNRYEVIVPVVEYILDCFNKFYDESIPKEIIEKYENYINGLWWSKEQGVKWTYNLETHKLDCSRRINAEIINALEELKTIHMESKGEPTFLSIESYECSLNNGKKIKREKLLKNGLDGNAVIIYPVTEEGKILLTCEPRVFTHSTVDIGFPAGYTEQYEYPTDAARRELLEETGYVPTELIHLGSFYQDQGCSRAVNHYYLALGCKKKADQHLDENEFIKYFAVTSEELKELVDCGFMNGLNTNYMLLKGEGYVKKIGSRKDNKGNN